MSLVLANTKKLYRKAFLIESILLLFFISLCGIIYPEQLTSFLLGALAAFLPQIAFMGYVFYWKKDVLSVSNKVKVFYRAEGLKLALTVSLFIVIFLCVVISPLGLFAGYLFFVVLNALVPALLNIKSTH